MLCEAQFGVAAALVVGADAAGFCGVLGGDVGVGGLELLGECGVDEVCAEVRGVHPVRCGWVDRLTGRRRDGVDCVGDAGDVSGGACGGFNRAAQVVDVEAGVGDEFAAAFHLGSSVRSATAIAAGKCSRRISSWSAATLYLEFGYEQMATWAKEEAIRWGGRPPTDKLQGQPYARDCAGHDRMLVDALARCRAPKLRRIAAWSARRAYTIAGIAEIDWIRAGLDALDNDDPLPYPFDSRTGANVWDTFLAERRIEMWTTDDNGEKQATTALIAHRALVDADMEDPLSAAFNALRTAAITDGHNYLPLIAELRREFFPKLAPADQYERWIGHSV